MSSSTYTATRLSSANDSLRLATGAMAAMNNTTASVVDPARAAESNTIQIMAVLTTMHVLALACVVLRIYTRIFVVQFLGHDDIFIVLATVCASGGWAAFLIQAQHGLGKHQDTLSDEDLVIFRHAGFWQAIVTAAFALAFLKLSIGFNLLRLGTTRWYTWALRATMVVVACYSVTGIMTLFFHCAPMAGSWDFSLKPKCYPTKLFMTFGLINTAFNIATDILFATFPVFVIWPLKMRRKLRLYLICILSLGYFAVAMGVVKAVYQTFYMQLPDKTFDSSITFYGFLELNFGIIAACAVTLKPLFNRILNLHTVNPYSDQQPLRYTTYKRSILINLNPHPDNNWTGPRTHSYKLSKSTHSSKPSKSSHSHKLSKLSLSSFKHHRSRGSDETLGTSSRRSSVSSFGDFYTIDNPLPVPVLPLRIQPRPRPTSSVYSQEVVDTYAFTREEHAGHGQGQGQGHQRQESGQVPAIPLKSPQRVAQAYSPKQRFTVSALRKPHGNWV
ncbi:hypothetical protein OQA88_1254 [Cercophora sp. LCS_1]